MAKPAKTARPKPALPQKKPPATPAEEQEEDAEMVRVLAGVEWPSELPCGIAS